MAFTFHDKWRQRSTEDAGDAPDATPPPALATSAPVPAGAPKAGGESAPAKEEPPKTNPVLEPKGAPKEEREHAPAKEEPLPKANPVLDPALVMAPKAGAGAAPPLPNAPPLNALVAAVEDAPPAVAAAPPNAKAPAGAWAKEKSEEPPVPAKPAKSSANVQDRSKPQIVCKGSGLACGLRARTLFWRPCMGKQHAITYTHEHLWLSLVQN